MEKSIIVRDPDKMSLWRDRIAECQSSGQQVAEWCSSRGLSVKTYYYWHRKIQRIASNIENATSKQFYDISSIVSTNTIVASLHVGICSADIYEGADEKIIGSLLRAMKSC